MSKFKIEKAVSRINRVKLQASIEEPVAAELALMCEWSDNDRNYVVNQLLRFALSQDAEFQAYKESVNSSGGGKASGPVGSGRHRTAVAATTEPTVTESVSTSPTARSQWKSLTEAEASQPFSEARPVEAEPTEPLKQQEPMVRPLLTNE